MMPWEYVLVVLVCLVLGREVGKWLLDTRSKGSDVKRAALDLSIRLREFGLKLLPTLLEDLLVGNVADMIKRIHDLNTIAKAGDDAIMRELNGTFEHVLAVKLSTVEGRAVVAAKLAEAEKLAVVAAAAVI